MPVKDLGDPRLEALLRPQEPVDQGARPTISLPRRGLPPIAIAGILGFVALLLFITLEMRRTARLEPPLETAETTAQIGAAPPPLYIPPQIATALQPTIIEQRPVELAMSAPRPVIIEQSRPAPIVYAPPQIAPQMLPPQLPQPRVSSGAPLVVDMNSAKTGEGAVPGGSGAAPGASSIPPVGRVRASTFANRSMTVPQGHLIPAVLESGFDSSQPGFARAIVSRDVRGFDNKNVLIPRGSRLIGQYRSVTTQGQRRALINWTRLIRPDGMTIAMESPAVDPQGRGGVPANVNTHFLQRFGDALLQSTVSLGSLLAGGGRAVTGPVVMVSGTAGSAAQQLTSGNTYPPTLTVPAGKSISVFVAHDLDFSSAERSR